MILGAVYMTPFSTKNSDFISHNSDFISRNREIKSRNYFFHFFIHWQKQASIWRWV